MIRGGCLPRRAEHSLPAAIFLTYTHAVAAISTCDHRNRDRPSVSNKQQATSKSQQIAAAYGKPTTAVNNGMWATSGNKQMGGGFAFVERGRRTTHQRQDGRTGLGTTGSAWRVPTGYSTRNWDPKERPIFVLGSVFDANSLGKWIYDWMVYHYGGGTPLADMAGDLWIILTEFAVKLRRARFNDGGGNDKGIDGGERLWRRLQDVVSECEDPMWRAASSQSGGGVSMGVDAAKEFVDTMFGRERRLSETERWMSKVRLWIVEFDKDREEEWTHVDDSDDKGEDGWNMVDM